MWGFLYKLAAFLYQVHVTIFKNDIKKASPLFIELAHKCMVQSCLGGIGFA